jgi:hypothetical protein
VRRWCATPRNGCMSMQLECERCCWAARKGAGSIAVVRRTRLALFSSVRPASRCSCLC